MSDRETLTAMLDRAGIFYEEDGCEITIPQRDKLDDDGKYVFLPGGGIDPGPNRGYSMFVSVAYFDEAGTLVAWGAWE